MAHASILLNFFQKNIQKITIKLFLSYFIQFLIFIKLNEMNCNLLVIIINNVFDSLYILFWIIYI